MLGPQGVRKQRLGSPGAEDALLLLLPLLPLLLGPQSPTQSLLPDLPHPTPHHTVHYLTPHPQHT